MYLVILFSYCLNCEQDLTIMYHRFSIAVHILGVNLQTCHGVWDWCFVLLLRYDVPQQTCLALDTFHFFFQCADTSYQQIGELRSGSPRLVELNDFVRQRHNKGLLDVLSFSEVKEKGCCSFVPHGFTAIFANWFHDRPRSHQLLKAMVVGHFVWRQCQLNLHTLVTGNSQ